MNKKNLKRKGEKGITLVALIITIIVLLILAVVAIRAIEGDGIIKYAKNARDNYEKAQENELILLQGYIDTIEQNSPIITWTKTSEGELAVGSTVKASNGEEFYVISSDNSTTVTLLAKHNLNEDGSAQDTSDAYKCAFSASKYWETDPVDNLNSITHANATAVNKAKAYGAKLGVTTGRLMTKSDLSTFGFVESETAMGGITLKNEPGFIYNSNYWLASTNRGGSPWGINTTGVANTMFDFSQSDVFGIRVLLEIPKASIK